MEEQYEQLIKTGDTLSFNIKSLDKKIAELQHEREQNMKKMTTTVHELIRVKAIIAYHKNLNK